MPVIYPSVAPRTAFLPKRFLLRYSIVRSLRGCHTDHKWYFLTAIYTKYLVDYFPNQLFDYINIIDGQTISSVGNGAVLPALDYSFF